MPLVGFPGLTNLESLDRSCCDSLASLPYGVAGLGKLQTFVLVYGKSLVSLPDSNCCLKLVSLPDSTSGLSKLQNLNLCPRRRFQSRQVGDPHHVRLLDSGRPPLDSLSNLKCLRLGGCSSLTSFSDLSGLVAGGIEIEDLPGHLEPWKASGHKVLQC